MPARKRTLCSNPNSPWLRAPQRNIADTGLSLLLQICESFEGSEFATQFYRVYYLQLMQEIFAVMTGARGELHNAVVNAFGGPLS